MVQRILLDSKTQEKLIVSTKNKLNLTWRDLANILGFSEGYLKNELRKGQRTLNKKTYNYLISISGLHINSVKYVHENWGQIKGGKNSVSKPRKEKLLLEKQSEELAELIGIILGDGNIYCLEEKSIYVVRIAGHKKEDKKYLLEYVKPLLENLFNLKLSIYFAKKSNEMIIYKQSKDLIYTLKHFGLKPGNKKTTNARIPEWVFSNKKYMKATVRGLIDTDGSVYPKTRKHSSPTIWITSAIPSLRSDIEKIFKILGYKTSKWSKTSSPPTKQLSMGNKKEVLKYYKNIGFNNPKHEKRFKKFLAPVV